MEKILYKYEYLLHCWGGFWNKNNIKIHKEPEINYKWFNTPEDRQQEIDRLNNLKEIHSQYLNNKGLYNDSCIVMTLSEGYLTRFRFIIQSLCEVEGEIITIENDLGYGVYSIKEFDVLGSIADYMKEWKYDVMELPDNHERLFSTLILRT
jgi:hypothetical protein